VLVWETDQDAPTRDLDVAQATSAFATHKLLLDGQQRVTSLRAVLCDEPIRVRGRKKPIDILFNLEHPEGAPVELTEVDDDSESPLLADEETALDEEEDEADDLQPRLRRRTFVVASKALAAIPTWIRVSDVFNPKKGDWALLKPLGLQPDDPLYEKYSQRLQKLYSVKIESAAMTRSLDQLGLALPVHLIGHSFGALVALDFALDRRDRVPTLVLAEPPAFWVVSPEERQATADMRMMDALLRTLGPPAEPSDDQLLRFQCALGNCGTRAPMPTEPAWVDWVSRRSALRGPSRDLSPAG
jgi:hypothetical protein